MASIYRKGFAPPASPTAVTQTYSTSTVTHAAPTTSTVSQVAATNVTPYGFNQTQANSIPVTLNALIADVANTKQVLNAVVDALQAEGLLG